MRLRGVRVALLAVSTVGAFLNAMVAVDAGEFGLREQSVAGQGSSFAGVAAGGSLSSTFWNPAVITQYEGKNVQAGISGIFPNASHSYTASTLATLAGLGVLPAAHTSTADNSGVNALVPATYSNWQLNDGWWIGLSVNAPFGLAVDFPTAWAGAAYAQSSEVKTYNLRRPPPTASTTCSASRSVCKFNTWTSATTRWPRRQRSTLSI